MASVPQPPTAKPRPKRINVRKREVMDVVQREVEGHYRSSLVERIRANGGVLEIGNTTVRLAKQFGFCYGVERAIDLAYAARKVFPDKRLSLIGEIIHNPEVNRQLAEMGIRTLEWRDADRTYEELGEEDVVIVPAFGATTEIMDKLNERGCLMVDTTCGDVMSVWKRVRKYAAQGFTSIIHGKAEHEETRATASRALGDDGLGHYLVLLTLKDVDVVCEYIRHGGFRDAFLERFKGKDAHSEGFDPDLHLRRVGVANQTTMLKSETLELQRRIAQAVRDRDGDGGAMANFQFFDTICGATQERQDALFEMLDHPMDMLLVVGGYNSSNTSHLVEIGEQQLPSFFIGDARCLKSLEEIVHFDLHSREETTSYSKVLAGHGPATIGITAGASCPNNLIEDTIRKVFELRGISPDALLPRAASAAGGEG
ncbi:4-hydroxy-3-methylbut-2-enyl diphosphate reductase [soil metagenome]